MKKGLFIAFEGIDGCGKSTQLKKLAEHIFNLDKHNHVILTRNPYRDTDIRAILRAEDDPLTEAEQLAELFINDRKKHVEEVVIPNLSKGFFVLSDRYKLSTIAYQSAQGLDINDLIKKHIGLPIPDMTFIVDVSSKTAGGRIMMEKGRDEHKFESNLAFLEKVRMQYHLTKEILKNENIFIINGDNDVESIFNEIKEKFNEIYIGK